MAAAPLDADADDVRQLSVSTQDRVAFRLLRGASGGDDATAWITELAVLLFDAQGHVLQLARSGDPSAPGGFFGEDGNLLARRPRAKDATEKELVAFSLSKLHPFVEVVGCLATYAEDEIARSPRLNDFRWTCDLSSSGADEDAKFRGERPLRAAEFAHDPRTSAANVVVLCKLFRNHWGRGEWRLHTIGAPCAVRCPIAPVLAEAMQVFLLDLIPEIEIPNRNALTSVLAVCAALSFDEFLGVERHFPDCGVGKDDFARVLLFALLQARPELQRLARAPALVALLFEMFEQIDINGDARVDWEEFTTFCMSLGLIATSDQALGAAPGLRAIAYRQVAVGGAKARSFPYQVSRIKAFSQLKRVAVIENKSAVVLMYDADLVLHHEMTGVEKLLGKVAVLDVEHIATRNLLAISSSDHAITLWAIVNPATGAYVFASKIVARHPVTLLKWCGPLKRLLASGGGIAHDAQLWDIETQRVDARLGHHRDRLTDFVELGASGLFATCSFDHTIAVWEAATQRVAFVLEGHAQAVLALDYAHQTLLSSGFEYQAYCWSVPARALLATLGGHQHRLIGAKFVLSRSSGVGATLAVTGDESGHFKLWDVFRCAKGSSNSASAAASVLQSFELRAPSVCRLSAFACGVEAAKSTESDVADVVVGSLQLYRFRALAPADESAAPPPRHVVYNTVANTFVGAVDGCVTVWNANSGEKVEEPIQIRDADVCGLVFDVPRERKLFIATSDGCIRLYNPITGMLMTKSQIHDGAISSLLFCPRTCCLISTGYDRNLCVSHSTAGKTDVEVLRTVANAHESCITACAFSAALALVATGDDAGGVQVFDFQKLYLLFRCESHRYEIRALHFHAQAPLLVSGDAGGVVFVWQATGAAYTAAPLMRLALHSQQTPHHQPTPATPHAANAPTITALCSTPESAGGPAPLVLAACENGEVYAWDFRVLAGAARKRAAAAAGHFEYQLSGGADAAPQQQEGYNPLLRVAHKQSVLKLRPEDRGGGGRGGLALRRAREQPLDATHTGALVCASSFSWTAHGDAVLTLRSVPDPGLVFTASQDGSIKVWDTARECIGAISTRASKTSGQHRSTPPDARDASPPAAPDDATSAWKFTHHVSSDASQRHTRIAAEVIRKHARATKRAQRLANATRKPSLVAGGDTSGDERAGGGEDAAAAALSEPTGTSSRVAKQQQQQTGIDAILASQPPFSDISVRAGVQQGLFGPRESRQLKELSQNAALMAAVAKKSALAPLSDELAKLSPAGSRGKRRAAKAAGTLDENACRALGMMRTMTNFPLELQRRSAAARAGAIQALDVAPSPFLLEKLCEASDAPGGRGGARSTPKRKLKMHLDASVVVLRNVSLPKLPEAAASALQPPAETPAAAAVGVAVDALGSPAALKACASAPVLGGSCHAPASVDDPPRRSNIERKLRLYEEIAERSGATEICTPHRHSQPAISAWKSTPTAAAAASAAAAPRKSSELSAGGFAHNPFGPYYTPKQVIEFGNILTRFDEDFSGDLDQQEWVTMLQSFRPSFGLADLEATEKLFRSLDRDDSGRVSLREILPAMFSKATSEQLQKMRAFIRAHTDDKAATRPPPVTL